MMLIDHIDDVDWSGDNKAVPEEEKKTPKEAPVAVPEKKDLNTQVSTNYDQ